ncbi:MAG: carboxypeptidase regulatory-like domain-containing protein [Saprospiraceae bacterium]|nr:carboxypeptidase regulatory-like domain-containing protein [Saprospiraceae bacterium]
MARKLLLIPLVFTFLLPCAQAQFRSLLKKANKQYELHAYNLAIETYLEALERRPEDVEALGKLADCYRMINDMENAAAYYQRATRQNDPNPAVFLNFGKVLKAVARYDQAKGWFQEYAKTEPAVGNHYAQTCDFAKVQVNSPRDFQISNERINSSASDFGPAFFQEQLVFSSARVDIQRSSTNWTGKADNQLYIARMAPNGQLEAPLFLKSSYNNEFNEGPVAYSPDGRHVAYTRNNFVDGTRHIPASGMQLSLFVAEVNSAGDWINARPFPHNGNDFSTGFPAWSPDGSVLYYASNRGGGFGGYDIYASSRTESGWSAPQNLGPVVNTPGHEMTPFFDGEVLYFASDWHPGLGGMDMFRAEQLNGTWTRVVNMGVPLNSPRDDYGYIHDKIRNLGFLTSNRVNGKGHEDIYQVRRNADQVVLKVINASTGAPIPNATLDFSACGRGVMETGPDGSFNLQVTPGLSCRLLINKPGFLSETLNLSTAGLQGRSQVEVPLAREGESYRGFIMDYNSRQPLAGVTIIATNQRTGGTLQVTTDASGAYQLALQPEAVYVLRYSRPGFRDVNRTIRTFDGQDNSILGTISLLPSTDAPPTAGTGEIDISPLEPTPPSRTGNEEEETTTVESGYSVQVAALRRPDLDPFSDLSGMGKVYSVEEDGRYKIRVGVFPTRAEAQDALARVKRRGYSGAFIVPESGRQITSEPAVTTGKYMIQLAAYRNPRWFSARGLESVGTITDRKKGDLTVKYLSGFSSLQEARSALDRAQTAGFDSAFIVEEVGGQLRKVN